MGASNESTGREPGRAVAAVATLMLVAAFGLAASFAGALTAARPSAAIADIALVSTTTSLADGTATYKFPDGVTLTLAPGWTISCEGPTWVCAGKPGALIQVSSGTSHAADIHGDAAWGSSNAIKLNGLTNVTQEPQGITAVNGKNYTQILQINYVADEQTNQGSRQRYGVWIDLFNPSTQLAGFIDLCALSADGVQAAVPDANRMVASIL